MAFVVKRRSGGFEIRESVHTDKGPRARSLATFHTLDEDILRRAADAATTPFDDNAVRTSARRVGAPFAGSSVDEAARRLLLELRAGRRLSPGLRALLQAELGPRPAASLQTDGEFMMWTASSDEERGRALVDLLELGDALPARRRGPLKFPPLHRV